MPIPKEILAVERPKNSIVIAYGKKPRRYAGQGKDRLPQRRGRRFPVNGTTIGHRRRQVVPLEEEAMPPRLGIGGGPQGLGNVVLAQKLSATCSTSFARSNRQRRRTQDLVHRRAQGLLRRDKGTAS
jgi:hypothetical protein